MNRNALVLHAPIEGKSQKVTTSGSSQLSAALPIEAHGIRVYATAACYIRVDGNAVTTTDAYLPAGVVEYFPIPPNDSTSATGAKIAYMQDTTPGSLYITPLSA